MRDKLRSLLPIFSARLSQRIVFWVFVSIVVVEAIILVPSVYRRKQELLSQLSEIVDGKVEVIQLYSGNSSDKEVFAHIQQLERVSAVLGGKLYRPNGDLVGEFGESPELSLSLVNRSGIWQRENWNGIRFDVARSLSLSGKKYILILRYDSSHIGQELQAFIWRITGLVLLISVFVTITTMIVLSLLVINPILLLRRDLLVAGESVTNNSSIPKFQSSVYHISDELKEVIAAFEKMYRQIYEEITHRQKSENALRESEVNLKERAQQLQQTLQELRQTQVHLIQSEKMSSLGQLVAGIAHEINNPVSFIDGNLQHALNYFQSLLQLLEEYQQAFPEATPTIQQSIEDIDLDFLLRDLPKLLESMKSGTERIREIVISLRSFSRLDEAEIKTVDIHAGIDSTLAILQSRLKDNADYPEIQTILNYGNLPPVECYPGQLNQVFLQILTNAIDSLESRFANNPLEKMPTIQIYTEVINDRAVIRIVDNGIGITEEVQKRLFDPFFTTKAVGKGTGLGLAVSYQIVVDLHQGEIECISADGEGAEFAIKIPICQRITEKSSKL